MTFNLICKSNVKAEEDFVEKISFEPKFLPNFVHTLPACMYEVAVTLI